MMFSSVFTMVNRDLEPCRVVARDLRKKKQKAGGGLSNPSSSENWHS